MHEITPVNGPWFEVIQLLRHCDEAFNESAAAVTWKGMPTNRIACISHMLCDEKFLACIIPLTDVVEPAADIHKSYKTWIKDYKNPFVDGLWAEDLNSNRGIVRHAVLPILLILPILLLCCVKLTLTVWRQNLTVAFGR